MSSVFASGANTRGTSGGAKLTARQRAEIFFSYWFLNVAQAFIVKNAPTSYGIKSITASRINEICNWKDFASEPNGADAKAFIVLVNEFATGSGKVMTGVTKNATSAGYTPVIVAAPVKSK